MNRLCFRSGFLFLLFFGIGTFSGCERFPLHRYALEGDERHAREILEKDASFINEPDDEGNTPLFLAVDSWKKFNPALIRFLVENGANVSRPNRNGNTPLHRLAVRDEVDLAAFFVRKGADVNARNDRRRTPLHTAAYYGREKMAIFLLDHGANIQGKDIDGNTPLHLAASCRGDYMARVLIDRGAEVDAKNRRGETPLHLAAAAGNVEMCRLLVEHGADINARTHPLPDFPEGKTPLEYAKSNRFSEMTRKFLKSHGGLE